MGNEKPSYQELEEKLTEAENSLKAIRDEKIDAFIGKKGVYVLRLKTIEDALHRAKDELEIRVRERTADLERANRELQDFVHIASHDLQEPLRKIRTFGEMLVSKDRHLLSEEGADYLQRMENAAHRMQELLAALLRYSRVETRIEDYGTVDLKQAAEEALENLETAGATVDLREIGSVEADHSQMVQLFQNLIGNSLKFHPKNEKPAIRIYSNNGSSEKSGQSIKTIYVEDNGIGFDETHGKRIFQPFERLHGRNEYKGTGMGLAICKRIVERHGGKIRAQSQPNKGATFIVTLPSKHSFDPSDWKSSDPP